MDILGQKAYKWYKFSPKRLYQLPCIQPDFKWLQSSNVDSSSYYQFHVIRHFDVFAFKKMIINNAVMENLEYVCLLKSTRSGITRIMSINIILKVLHTYWQTAFQKGSYSSLKYIPYHSSDNCSVKMKMIFPLLGVVFVFVFLNNLHAPCRARTHDPKIESRMLCWLS